MMYDIEEMESMDRAMGRVLIALFSIFLFGVLVGWFIRWLI